MGSTVVVVVVVTDRVTDFGWGLIARLEQLLVCSFCNLNRS